MNGASVSLSKERPGEIASLTSLRGGLALWVVMHHFWNDVLRLFPSADLVAPVALLGNMAVSAFFMLSGFVLAYNYAERFRTVTLATVSRFLMLRLARVYPVHLATLLAVAAMVWVSRRVGFSLKDAGYSSRDFVLNLFLAQTWVADFVLNWNYPSWSISSEWFAYLLFPFLTAWGMHRLTTPAAAAVCGLFALAGAIAVTLFWRPWPFTELILVVPTFIAGMAIHWALLGQPAKACPSWLPDVLALSIALVCFVPHGAVAAGLLLTLFLSLIAALAWLGNDCHAFWTTPAAVFLGEVSYSLYMTHTLVQKMVQKLLPSARFESAEPLTKLGVLTAYLGLITLLCLGCYYLIEKPCRGWFRRRARDTTQAGTVW